MSDEEMDRRIADALSAEGARARPRPDAWAAISSEVRRPRVPWPILGAVAAAVLLIAGAAFFALRDGDDEGTQVVTEPTQPSTTTSSTTTSTSTTTTSSTTTTTTVPAEREVVYAPIDMGPLPPARSTPPETLIAVRPDGTLVQVETVTGRVLREIANHGDLRDSDPETGMSYGIDGVALSPDGDTVWMSFCCEPAAGSMWWTRLSDPGTQERFADAYSPAFATSPSWATSATMWAAVWDLRDGLSARGSRRDLDPASGGGYDAATLSPDGRHLAVIEWDAQRFGGPLRIVDPSYIIEGGDCGSACFAPTRIVDDSPITVEGETWAKPVFRRDGLLLVAQSQPSWEARLVDPVSGTIVGDAPVSYGGVLLDQDYDPSAEWLLYVVAPNEETLAGSLRWVGPNGESGTVPGEFYAASW